MTVRPAVTILSVVGAACALFLGLWLVFFVQPTELGESWDEIYGQFHGVGISAVVAFSLIWTLFALAVVLALALALAARAATVLSLRRELAIVLLSIGLTLPGIFFPWVTMDLAISHVAPDLVGRLGAVPMTIVGTGIVLSAIGAALWAVARRKVTPYAQSLLIR